MCNLIAEMQDAVCDNPVIGDKMPALSQSLEAAKGKKDTPRQHLPLSQQKEFRAIKNLVIQEAKSLRQNIFTFEDADMVEEYTDVPA